MQDTHRWLLDNPGAEVTVDIAAATHGRCPTVKQSNFPLDGFSQHCLLEGIDQLGFPAEQGPPTSTASNRNRVHGSPDRGPAGRRHRPGGHATRAVSVLNALAERGGHRLRTPRGADRRRGHRRGRDRRFRTTRALAADADATLLGAVGGPKWSHPDAPVRPEQGLLDLRAAMNVYANLRPVKTHPALYPASPAAPEFLEGVDILVVRELTGGIYFGDKDSARGRSDRRLHLHRDEIERVVRMAAGFARAGAARSRRSTRPTYWRRPGCGAASPTNCSRMNSATSNSRPCSSMPRRCICCRRPPISTCS